MNRICQRFARTGLFCLFLAGICLTLAPGCGRRATEAEKRAVREALLNQEIEKDFERVQTLRAEGNIEEALGVAGKALADPRYAAHKPRFFAEKVGLLLARNDDAAARQAVLAAWKDDPASARAVFGQIHSHLRQMNRHADDRAWCRSLLEPSAGLPADLRGQALEWQFGAALALADPEIAKADMDTLLAGLKPEEAEKLLSRALGELIDAGRNYPLADTLLRHLDRKPENGTPLFGNLLASLSLRRALGAREWDRAAEAFDACAARLPDGQLHALARAFFTALQKDGQAGLLEQASKKTVFNAGGKTNSVNYASRVWVECGVAANKGALPERLDALLGAGIAPVQVGNLFDRYFYEMAERPEIIRSLCAVGERLIATCADTNTVNSVKVKVLDGAFITENYDLAVSMLEQGIPGKDKAWHDMSLPKVKAHRAMAKNQPREAAGFFRDFMNAWLATGQEEEFDPATGVAYSREWILGRNAKRIAGLLDSVPDKAGADQARAEAKAYFKTALEKAANDPEALKLLKEETKGFVD
jgi:hypothetical protein